MNTPKTAEEIQAMIAKLEASKKDCPEYSLFGDNNWKSIDEVIAVLRGEYVDADEIYDNEDDFEDASQMVLALEWMDGEVDDEDICD